MTPSVLQDALVSELGDLLSHETYPNSRGEHVPIKVYPQDLPIQNSFDEEGEPFESTPDPYLIVRLNEGSVENTDSAQTVDVILVICLYDNQSNRQGYRDVLHVMNQIMERYGKNQMVGPMEHGRTALPFTLLHPIKWVMQDDDTHPYYFGAMNLKFETPAVCQEVLFT